MGAKPLPWINKGLRLVNPDGTPTMEFYDFLTGLFSRSGGLVATAVGFQNTDGTVTTPSTAMLPSGMIALWPPTAAAPSGWIRGEGNNVSRNTYSGIFAVFGTQYGAGDGHTTFGLPDLRPGAVPWVAGMGWLPILSTFQGIIKT